MTSGRDGGVVALRRAVPSVVADGDGRWLVARPVHQRDDYAGPLGRRARRISPVVHGDGRCGVVVVMYRARPELMPSFTGFGQEDGHVPRRSRRRQLFAENFQG